MNFQYFNIFTESLSCLPPSATLDPEPTKYWHAEFKDIYFVKDRSCKAENLSRSSFHILLWTHQDGFYLLKERLFLESRLLWTFFPSGQHSPFASRVAGSYLPRRTFCSCCPPRALLLEWLLRGINRPFRPCKYAWKLELNEHFTVAEKSNKLAS